MNAERSCERCAVPLDGRRPDARYCSPACRRGAARQREARRAPLAPDPDSSRCEDAACRAHACQERLRRLEDRLDELARHLPSADGRLMARVMRDALRGDREPG